MTESIKITNRGAEQETVLGVIVQRGYLYEVVARDESAWDCSEVMECEDGSTHTERRRFGYHGNDVPPCGADYLYCEDDGSEFLVISSESDPANIPTVDGFRLEAVRLDEGEFRHDGTWQFHVIKVQPDGETTIAGYC